MFLFLTIPTQRNFFQNSSTLFSEFVMQRSISFKPDHFLPALCTPCSPSPPCEQLPFYDSIAAAQ